MKNILLYLFLFTSLTFYSQIPFTSINLQNVCSASELGKNDGRIEFSIIGGISPFTIQSNALSTHYYYLDKNDKTIFLDNLAPGRYFIHVLDADRNSDFVEFSIAQSPLNFTTSVKDKSVTIKATGGIPPYSYLIDNQYTSDNIFDGLSIGSHTVEVRDSNLYQRNPSINSTIIIEEIPVLTVTTFCSNVNCFGDSSGSITMNVTGGKPPYIYSKDGINYSKDNTFNNLLPGTYATYAKDDNGVEASSISTITQPDIPLSFTTTTNYTGTGCNKKGLITIVAEGGQAPYTYSKDNVDYDSNPIFTDLNPDMYTLYVKDVRGCISTKEVMLYPLPDMIPPFFSVTNVTCNGGNDGSVIFDSKKYSGTYTYEINGGAPIIGNIISGLSAGTYFIGVTNSNAGCGTMIKITITEPSSPLSFTTTSYDTFCPKKGSIIITALGGQEPYTYSKDGVNYDSNNVFSALNSGTYTLYVKDSNSCISIQEKTLYDLAPPSPFASSETNVSCNGGNDGTITLSSLITESYNFTYQSKDTIYQLNKDISISGSIIISGLSAGEYYIIATNLDPSCYSIGTYITITEPSRILNIVTAVSNVFCSGNNDGIITATVTGGKAPYFYSIDGETYVDSNVFYNLIAGTYSITVKDSNGNCGVITNIIVTESTPLSAKFTVKNQTIMINAAGGNGELKYAISPNLNVFSTTNTFTALAPGTYSVIIQDLNGCSLITDILVDPLAPSIEGQNVITIEFTSGQTLRDIVVEGQNIKWYSNQNSVGGKTTKINEANLPLATLLVDGTTYYASQTINGIESTERLAVTTKVKGSLSTHDFVLPNFSYYPNPLKHALTINNTIVIDEIEIYSVSGQSILSKRIDSDHSEIDLSNISSGLYFLKVKSEGQVKIVKLVKK